MKLSNNTLYIVSTPIGNLDDITIRAINVLKKSDIILCEDTRHSLKLLNHLKLKKKLVSYHKFNEKKQTPNIIEQIKQGKILSLISDAGTPLLSDPGKILINECIKNRINLVPIPGASSITAGMSISGFKDQFLFFGFLPKKENELKKTLKSISTLPFSLIFFSPAVKLKFYLSKFKIFFSGRKILIAKEITKIYESYHRGNIDDLDTFENDMRGELTIVISEPKSKLKKENVDVSIKIINKVKNCLKKYSVKDTVELISNSERVSKKIIYKLCLKLKK